MKMEEMFAEEAMSPMGGESGMQAAVALDAETDDALMSASPVVTVKARTLGALTKALNAALPIFEAPSIEVEAVDLKGEPLPVEIVKAIQMINAAYQDYMGEDAVDMMNFETDGGALIETAKIGKAMSDKRFVKFLKTPETKATEAAEEVEEVEGEEEMSEDDMMMRMM